MDYKKKKYDECWKEVCDEKGNHKPKHSSALILCLLEDILEILDKQTYCRCCKPACKEEITDIEVEEVTQTGVVNNNVDIDAILKEAKKKK